MGWCKTATPGDASDNLGSALRVLQAGPESTPTSAPLGMNTQNSGAAPH